MTNTWLLAFMTLPFLLAGVVDLALPWPPAVRYAQLALTSGLCLLVVAVTRSAGIL